MSTGSVRKEQRRVRWGSRLPNALPLSGGRPSAADRPLQRLYGFDSALTTGRASAAFPVSAVFDHNKSSVEEEKKLYEVDGSKIVRPSLCDSTFGTLLTFLRRWWTTRTLHLGCALAAFYIGARSWTVEAGGVCSSSREHQKEKSSD